ncbi:hypothetical protein EKO04_002658 [Ascochyta lentis]|uniref:C2H2-type domain-containing protein n=1 Tax=Ascochyta lentis TaxID=205686 RepID=A0A8H7J8A3_9PLEO|nr:hypothetical protein EKO04_002658 [Ascochyta lentis]
MSYDSSDGSYRSSWPQQDPGQNSEAYSHSGHAGSSCGRQTHPQLANGNSYYQYQNCDSANPQYSTHHAVVRSNPYTQSTAAFDSGYLVSHPTNGLAGAYQPGVYNSMPPQYGHQYGHQSRGWSDAQQPAVGSSTQRVMQSPVVASPTTYTSPVLPLVAPRPNPGVGSEYSSSHTWPNDAHSGSGSLNLQHQAEGRSMGGGAEYAVPCPYGCGTVLTGVHAVGNMTRHLKSKNCIGSGKDKTKYICPVQGCDKRYIRSDGLKVHLRKRHNIAQASDRTGSSEYEEAGY